MATTFPASEDDFATTSPANLGDDDSTGRTHPERHNDMESAMEAVQHYLLTGAFHSWAFPMISGNYECSPAVGYVADNIIEVNGWELASMFVPLQSGTIDRLAINVSTGGSTGSVVRLGMRAFDTSTFKPGTLIVDGGTVDTTSTGVKEVTISQAVTAGTPYVLTATQQGAPTTRTTCSLAFSTGMWDSNASVTPSSFTCYASGTTGALPSTQTWALAYSRTPRIWVRVAV